MKINRWLNLEKEIKSVVSISLTEEISIVATKLFDYTVSSQFTNIRVVEQTVAHTSARHCHSCAAIC